MVFFGLLHNDDVTAAAHATSVPGTLEGRNVCGGTGTQPAETIMMPSSDHRVPSARGGHKECLMVSPASPNNISMAGARLSNSGFLLLPFVNLNPKHPSFSPFYHRNVLYFEI